MATLYDNQIVFFMLAVFGVVFLLAIALSSALARSSHVGSRLARAKSISGSAAGVRAGRSMQDFLPRNLDEKVFGLDETARGQLRRDLVRAGFFSRQALPMYLAIRIAAIVGFPLLAWLYVSTVADDFPLPLRIAMLGFFVLVGFQGPKTYLSFRQRGLERRYRESFPDMMDVLVVCVDSGLSLEAAIDRVGREIGVTNRYLGINLQLMGLEMRAGRSTMQSLQALADRLGIDEAQSLATLLRQSSELGTSISESLRVYSEEMRDRRMSRAEEKANSLPVKLTLPLALFIFPVILIVIMMPTVIRLMQVMG